MAVAQMYRPDIGIMRVAGFMSGTGSNLVKILEHQQRMTAQQGTPPYKVVVVFTDNPKSNAAGIARKFNLPLVVNDVKQFYRDCGNDNIKDLKIREDFDAETIKKLGGHIIDVVAYAGYMLKATPILIKKYSGVNIHPGDLSVMIDGKRKYTGAQAVKKAILAGENQIRATTHIVREEVDYGERLLISAPLDVVRPKDFDKENKKQVQEVADDHQSRLKPIGDHVIFPKTLELIATGRISIDENTVVNGNRIVYLDGKPIPNGMRVEEMKAAA